MQLGQWIRQFGARVSGGVAALLHPGGGGGVPINWRLTLSRLSPFHIVFIILGAIIGYYLLGALISNKVDDDPAYAGDKSWEVEGGSRTVSLATSLLDREVNHNGWVANAPFYLPTALLHNMASYQTGIVRSISGFAEALSKGLAARAVPSVDLSETVERLQKRPDVWSWAFSEPLGYLGNSRADYSEGLLDLNGYNVALGDHTSQFPREPAILALILTRFAHDLDDAATALEQEANFHPFILSRRIGDAFYRTRGIAYGEAILLRGLRADFANVVADRRLGGDFDNAQRALLRSALFSPIFIVSGAPDSTFLPSHPLSQAYYALAARQALAAIIAKLS